MWVVKGFAEASEAWRQLPDKTPVSPLHQPAPAAVYQPQMGARPGVLLTQCRAGWRRHSVQKPGWKPGTLGPPWGPPFCRPPGPASQPPWWQKPRSGANRNAVHMPQSRRESPRKLETKSTRNTSCVLWENKWVYSLKHLLNSTNSHELFGFWQRHTTSQWISKDVPFFRGGPGMSV